MTPEMQLTDKQMKYRKIFRVGLEDLKDFSGQAPRANRWESALANMELGGGALAVDVAEGALVKALETGLKNRYGENGDYTPKQKRWRMGLKNGEEWVTDNIISDVADKIVQNLTGVPNAEYASHMSKVFSDWANLLSFIKPGNEKYWSVKVGKHEFEYVNMVNPVTVETVLRGLMEIPLVENPVRFTYEKVNQILKKSKAVRYFNNVATQIGIGYFFQTQWDKAARA